MGVSEMKKHRYLIILACVLIAASAVLFVIDYLVFGNLHDNMFYLLQDIAFLPLQILFVGIIVERVLSRRETEEKLHKMNMAIGTFFSEIGNPLSSMLLQSAADSGLIIERLHVRASWKAPEFIAARKFASSQAGIKFNKADLPALRAFLVSKRPFLLALIENPNLLEHERFTDLLLSVFHLCEELESRPSLDGLPLNDVAHIHGDIARAYQFLMLQWLDYMQHLRTDYPFLYSHYLRIHPFQPHPSAIIE